MTGARPRLSSSRRRSFGCRARARPTAEHLLLAAGEQAAAPVAQLGQRGEVPVRGVCVEPLAPVAETQVLRDREPEEQAARLRYVRDPESSTRARRHAPQVPSLDADRPAHRVHEAGDGA